MQYNNFSPNESNSLSLSAQASVLGSRIEIHLSYTIHWDTDSKNKTTHSWTNRLGLRFPKATMVASSIEHYW